MDRLGVMVLVAAILLFVSHWLSYQLGKHNGKAVALTWVTGINEAVFKKATDHAAANRTDL